MDTSTIDVSSIPEKFILQGYEVEIIGDHTESIDNIYHYINSKPYSIRLNLSNKHRINNDDLQITFFVILVFKFNNYFISFTTVMI